MNELFGLFLISIAIVFFATFVIGGDLTTKEKIKFALAIVAFLYVMVIGTYLWTELYEFLFNR